MPRCQFKKMHGAGNDFVVIDGLTQECTLSKEQMRRIGDRHYGIGCDQILLLLPPRNPKSDFYCRIYNADGSEAGQCGNGMRCLGQFIREQSLSHARRWRIETRAAIMHVEQAETGMRATLTRPQFDPQSIPCNANSDQAPYVINCLGRQFDVNLVNLGNGHAVVEVENVDSTPVDEWGVALASHEHFPEGVNVGFVHYQNTRCISLRVFERGVGQTLSCGSGAAAAVAVGYKLNKLRNQVRVLMPGGELLVSQHEKDHTMQIEGPVHTVFRGSFELCRG